MIFTGISDEAGASIESQIKAHQQLGWKTIEARAVEVKGFPKGNLHDIPDAAFDVVEQKLKDAGMSVYCFGSAIANWGKKIDQPFDLGEVHRAIPRMQRLGTKFVRIMSYAIRTEADQMADERFTRLREIVRMFTDAGIQPLHENCMNYGGMGWRYTLELLEKVPGVRLVFDTANPVFNPDYAKPEPRPRQDPWEFWTNVRDYVDHIHIKDARWNTAKNDADYSWPGEGEARVKEIVGDALRRGYKGALSIEPHIAVVFHDAKVTSSEETQFNSYVEYGRKLMRLVEDLKRDHAIDRAKGPLLAKG